MIISVISIVVLCLGTAITYKICTNKVKSIKMSERQLEIDFKLKKSLTKLD